MLLLNEDNKTVILSNIYDPIVFKNYWVLDLNMFDYKLADLTMLEEAVSPIFIVQIGIAKFYIPSSWYVMVFDEETTQLDLVGVSDLTNKDYTILVSNMNNFQTHSVVAKVLDYLPEQRSVYPTLSKSHMLCHPIYDNIWINIAPNDTYNRFLKNKYVSDL